LRTVYRISEIEEMLRDHGIENNKPIGITEFMDIVKPSIYFIPPAVVASIKKDFNDPNRKRRDLLKL
jgi:hypothetical protein